MLTRDKMVSANQSENVAKRRKSYVLKYKLDDFDTVLIVFFYPRFYGI